TPCKRSICVRLPLPSMPSMAMSLPRDRLFTFGRKPASIHEITDGHSRALFSLTADILRRNAARARMRIGSDFDNGPRADSGQSFERARTHCDGGSEGWPEKRRDYVDWRFENATG